MFQKNLQKIKTHILCSTIFFFENRAVYGVMYKNIVQPVRPQMITWRKRVVCSITKATDTHSEYVTLTAFPLQQKLHERVPMLDRHFPAKLWSDLIR